MNKDGQTKQVLDTRTYRGFVAFVCASTLITACSNAYTIVEPTKDYDFRILLTSDEAIIKSDSEPFIIDTNQSDVREVWLLTYRLEDLQTYYPILASLNKTETKAYLNQRFVRNNDTSPLIPSKIFSTQLAPDIDTYTYQEKSWEQWQQRVDSNFPGFHFDMPARICDDQIEEISTQDSPLYEARITDITFSSTTAYFVAHLEYSRAYLGWLKNGKVYARSLPRRNNNKPFHIEAYNRNKLFVSFSHSDILEDQLILYNIDGEILPSPRFPAGTLIRNISVGKDASAIAYGNTGLYLYNNATNTFTPFGNSPFFPQHLKVVTRKRVFAARRDQSSLSLYNGEKWRTEYRSQIGEEISKIDADVSETIAVGPLEFMLHRDNDSSAWTRIPPIYNTATNMLDVGILGVQKYLIVGDRGFMAIKKEGYWCTYDQDELTTFRSVEVAPDSSYALVAGDRQSTDGSRISSVIYKVTLKY